MAVLWAVAFVLVQAVGWREFTSVLSGTVVNGVNFESAALRALEYMASYFGVVLVTPILALASVIHWLLLQWISRNGKQSPKP